MSSENKDRTKKPIKVLVNGYGTIGKRVADAVILQDDMELIGVADVNTGYRMQIAQNKNYTLYASTQDAVAEMQKAEINVVGTLSDALEICDVVVDATPKSIAAGNKKLYDKAGVKSIFQGGEANELTGFSFVAQTNYDDARGKDSVRSVSCNTTALTRIINPLHNQGSVKKVRASLFRRAADPYESHLKGIINTVMPEPSIPSHHSPDVNTILKEVDITTIAAKGPFNVGHLHTVFIELNQDYSQDEVMELYRKEPRIAFVSSQDGVAALNSVNEIMRDIGRSRNDMWEVAVWKDILEVADNELMLVYQVHNEAIVIPENIDAIRAMTDSPLTAKESIEKTDQSLGIVNDFIAQS